MPFTYKRTEAYVGQFFDPATFEPLEDQVLVLPDEAPAMRGSIWIPERARQEEVYYRTGLVIAVGPGDRAIGLWCRHCSDVSGHRDPFYTSTIRRVSGPNDFGHAVANCPHCGSNNTELLHTGADGHLYTERRPMELKIGDRILYLQRPGSEVMFEGKEYMILHEDAETTQHVLAVLED